MRRPRDLLVLDFDGIVLGGAVVHVHRRGAVEIRRHAASRAATPEAALDEILGALGRTPPACAVRSAEAVAGLVRLPIASERGRTPEEIAQMLFWELEPLFAQQSAAQPLGVILEARGHLEHAQAERVLAVQQQRRAEGSRDAASARFGAIALELGYVTGAQLAEAVAIEERLGRAEEGHACGWSVQGASSDGGKGALWLAVGMPLARRRWWAEQLAARGLKLLALYPRFPAATGALDARANATLIEVEPRAVARSVVRKGALVSLEILPASDAEPPDGVCRELLRGTDPAETFVSGSLAPSACPSAARLEPPVRGVDDPWAWAAVAGAARHAAGRGGPAAAVPAHAPPRPLLRRPVVRWAAAIALLAGIGVAADRLAARSLSRAVRDLAEARGRLERITDRVRDVERTGAEAEALAREIDSLEGERDSLRARLKMLDDGAAARSCLLPRLLDALAGSVNDEILLDRTTEESPGRIRVEGRALSERSVQAFGRAVAARVLPLHLRVVDQTIRKGSPRGPYSFGFVLEPSSPEDA